MSVDSESKASTSLDRVTRMLWKGCHRRHLKIMTALPTGKSTRPLGVRDQSEMTLTCAPRWLAKGPILQEAMGYCGFVEPGDCVS